MQAFFSDLVPIGTIIFAVSSMLALGFSFTPGQVVGALRSWRFVVLALLVNFVVSPSLAYGLATLFSLEHDLKIGLLVLAMAAGSPSLLKQAQIAKGNIALAAGLLVVFVLATIVYLPLVVPRFVPGADVSVLSIARPLVLSMFVPLVAAMLLARFFPTRTAPLLPTLAWVSNISLLVLAASTVIANTGSIIDLMGTIVIPVALLYVVGAMAAGYLCGFAYKEQQFGLAFGTGQRNVSAALVVATQSILVVDTTVMIVITSIFAMFILFPSASLLGKYRTAGQPANAVRPAGVVDR